MDSQGFITIKALMLENIEHFVGIINNRFPEEPQVQLHTQPATLIFIDHPAAIIAIIIAAAIVVIVIKVQHIPPIEELATIALKNHRICRDLMLFFQYFASLIFLVNFSQISSIKPVATLDKTKNA